MAKKRELQYVIDGYMGSKLNKAFASVERKMKGLNTLGNKLTAGLTLPMLAVGGAAIAASRKMNEGMANVGSLIPGQVQRVAELKSGIQELAPAMGKSTSDLTDGAYQVISAFGDTADSLKLLEINSKAARGGVASTTDAINLTSAVTKGYGDTSAEAVQKAADLALMTVRLGQTSFPDLAASIGRVTPLTKGLGVSTEELFGVMATATGVTGGASEVSTQLRGVLQSLMTPTSAMTKLLKKQGYASGQAMVKGRGLQGAIDLIAREAKATDTPLSKFIGSIEGQTLAQALAGEQSAELTKKTAAMRRATGTTDEAFRAMTEGVNEAGFKLDQLQAKVETTGQKLGDALTPALLDALKAADPLIKGIAKVADMFANADPKTQKMVLGLLGMVAAVGPAMKLVAGLVSGFGGLVSIIGGAGAVLGAAIGGLPVWAILAAVLAIIGVVVLLVKNWDRIKAAMKAAWEWFIRFGTEGLGRFSPIVGLVATLAKNWDGVKSAVSAAWQWMKKAYQVLQPIIAADLAPFKWAWSLVKAEIKAVADFLNKVAAVTSKVMKNPIVRRQLGLKQIEARADGGPVSRGRSYLVGERGPELFSPGRSGSIVPNLALGGGVTMHNSITIHVAGGSSEDVRRGVMQGLDDFASKYDRMMRERRRRDFA